MKSTRRGFLGLIGGGAVAGPGALKGAFEKASSQIVSGTAIQNVPCGIESSCAEGGQDWRAREILDMLSFRNTPPRVPNLYEEWFADIHAMRSVSMVNKCRMQRERNIDLQVAGALREFLKEKKLSWVGLDEGQILALVKKAAGK